MGKWCCLSQPTNREICHLLFSKSSFQSTRVITSEYEVLHYRNRTNYPVNIDEDVFRLRLQKTSSRRLHNVLIKTNMFALALCLEKTSSRRLGQDQYIRLGYTFSRRLQDVFKTSSRCLQDVLPRRLQDVFRTSCKNVFKTS